MKATLSYSSGFEIPKNLPHAGDGGEDRIFSDSVAVAPCEGLALSSACGRTIFPEFRDCGDHWEVGAYAVYDGAYHALNAVWGVAFPVCKLSDIVSSFGDYATEAGYVAARRAIKAVQSHERNGKVERFAAALDSVSDELGNAI
jgi:hypothetical protein